jgi:putative aldouronate transport system substrate-binding protein
MKKRKKFLLTAGVLLLAFCLSFFFVSCKDKAAFAEGTEIRVHVTNAGRQFPTYNGSTPWTDQKGKTYNKGDLLPVWTHIEEVLKIKILGTTPKSGQNENEFFEAARATGFKDAEVYQGSPRQISDAGITGDILALNKHFDKMPNFVKFLEDNPSIKDQLVQADGNIYFTPYLDDINKLERMFLMRIDWVKKLLDAPSPAFDTQRTITPVYQAVYDYAGGKKVSPGPNNVQTFQISQNIIAIQNALPVKNGAALTQALRDYIDANYMNAKTGYANRSDLFISSKAAYDAYEMVAIMRAAKTNPVYLTGEDKDLITFYPRRQREGNSMRRIGAAWGIRGYDSKLQEHIIITKENTLQDIRMTDDFYRVCGYMTQLYKEGLILEDFDQERGTVSDFRAFCFQSNDGFMSHDYAASTVSLHDVIPPEDLARYGTIFESVVPPAAQWFSDEFEHFSNSNRTLKPIGGWGIVSTLEGDKLNAAIKLLDYPFSPDGLDVMTFGPKGLYWNEYTTISGQQVPKLIPQTQEDITKYAQGNWSNFLRANLGATLGCGHIKNTIAIETRVSNEHYANGIKRIDDSGMTISSLGTNVPPERRKEPVLVPLTEDQVEALGTASYDPYHREWENRAMKYGYGGVMPDGTKVPTAAEHKATLIAKGLEQTLKIYNAAFDTVKKK